MTRDPRPAADRHGELYEPSTRIVRDAEDYLGDGRNDIGRRVGADRFELFVATAPAEALRLQLTQRRPPFIALQDLGGGSASMHLLGALAGNAGSSLQHLAIRRSGHGVPLATLHFVELRLSTQSSVRVYSSDIDADTLTRRQLAQILLAHSRLGVLMVGNLPLHALSSALQPLRDAIVAGPWPNRNLLLVPLAAAAALAAQASVFAGSGVEVQVAPQATRPAQAWTAVTEAWNRVHGIATAGAEVPPPASEPAQDSYARTRPQGLQPLPVIGAPAAGAASPWVEYAERCILIKGMVSCCVFDTRSREVLAHVGARPAGEGLAEQGALLLAVIAQAGVALGLGPSRPFAAVTLTGHHLLLRPLPSAPGLALHAVLDGTVGHPELARRHLERLDETLPGAGGQ